MAFEVKIIGRDKLNLKRDQFKAAKEKFRSLLLGAANDFANDAVARIKRDYLSGPRPDKLGVVTGNLRSKIRYAITASGNMVAITVGTDVPYAAIHEYGGQTSPTFIFPKKSGGVLSFLLGGKRVFATHVVHPGSKIRARPFLEPGVKDALPAFEKNVEEGLRNIAEGTDGQ